VELDVHTLFALRLFQALHAQAEADILLHVEMRKQRIGLEHGIDGADNPRSRM
jgi:hypothetical protein